MSNREIQDRLLQMEQHVVQLENQRANDLREIGRLQAQLQEQANAMPGILRDAGAHMVEAVRLGIGDRPPPQPRVPSSMGKKVVYLEDGTEDWHIFVEAFRTQCELQQLNDLQARQTAKLSLGGQAAVIATGVLVHKRLDDGTLDPTWTIEAMLQELESLFVPPEASEKSRIQYDLAKQAPKESIQAWHGRLKQLFMRAYPGEASVTQLIRKFAQGLTDEVISDQVFRMCCRDYPTALRVALNEEAVRKNRKQTPALGRAMFTPKLHTEQVVAINELNQIDPATAECFNCKKIGHLKKDCPYSDSRSASPRRRSSPRRRDSSRDRGRRRSGRSYSPARRGGRNGKGRFSKRKFKKFSSELKDAKKSLNQLESSLKEYRQAEPQYDDDSDESSESDSSSEEEKSAKSKTSARPPTPHPHQGN